MDERRPISVKNPDAYHNNQLAVSKRLLENKSDGFTAWMSGNVKPFDGFSEKYFKSEIQARFELGEATKAEINERVIKPLKAAETKTGITLLLPDRDIDPSHIVFQTARFGQHLAPYEIDAYLTKMNGNSKFSLVKRALINRTIQLDTFIPTPGGIILCAGKVVPETLKAREILNKLFSKMTSVGSADYSPTHELTEFEPESALSIVDSRNITHTTVARLGKTADAKRLADFFKLVQPFLDSNLKNDPIRATVTSVTIGSSYNIMSKIAPHLITKP